MRNELTLGAPADRMPGTRGAPGVHAALGLLELLAQRESLTLAEIARDLGIAKSTLHRITGVLAERGWIVRDDTGRFELGIRALGIGSRSGGLPIVIAFRGVAAWLLTRHDETVCLAVLDGDDTTYIAKEDSSQSVRLVTHIGSRTSAFASASGRVHLARWQPESVVAYWGGRPLVTPVGRRLNGIEELADILAKVRRDGFAENVDETAAGLWSISVPVVNAAGVCLAALTIGVPTSRITPDRRALLIADLLTAGEHLSAGVAWLPAYNARAPKGG